MRIVIVTGGTGSIALQSGLYHSLEKSMDGIEVRIIVNAYDNGLSTGAVRRAMNGQILGPSDVRKNQTTRLRLMNSNDPWISLLEHRFTCDSPCAHEFCKEEVRRFLTLKVESGNTAHLRDLLVGAIDDFFWSPRAKQIEYDDFSLANVLYAGLARANGNSLRAAARIMADALDIPDNVLLNDDRSLFLGAVTGNGRRITDEGEIVSWGNETDPITDIFFVDADGNDALPELCFEAWHAIVDADLIVLSSGTQWSSLIPTYASRGFKTAIRASKAKIVLVVNRIPDNDSPGLTASGIVDMLVPRYFDSGRLHVLADKNGHPNMRDVGQSERSKIASFTQTDLSTTSESEDKHNSTRLAHAIGYVLFEEYINSSFFLFDYDNTLIGKEHSYPRSSQFNISGISWLNSHAPVGICTGNTIRALRLRNEPAAIRGQQETFRKPLRVFADGGVNEYEYDMQPSAGVSASSPALVRCVAPYALLPSDGQHAARAIIDALVRAGIPASKIENRSNAVIAIKPVASEHRDAMMSLARSILSGSDLVVCARGRTTIEIHKPTLSKLWALTKLLEEPNSPTITYVGDECESGNDHDIQRLSIEGSAIKCLHVSSPAKTAFFIRTLIAHLENGNR